MQEQASNEQKAKLRTDPPLRGWYPVASGLAPPGCEDLRKTPMHMHEPEQIYIHQPMQLSFLYSSSVPTYCHDLTGKHLGPFLSLFKVFARPVELGRVDLLVKIGFGAKPLLVLSELIPSSTVATST